MAVRDHREILYPRPLKNMKVVVTAVMESADKVAKAEKAYEEIPKMLRWRPWWR